MHVQLWAHVERRTFHLEQLTPIDNKHQETCKHHRESEGEDFIFYTMRGHCYKMLMGWFLLLML